MAAAKGKLAQLLEVQIESVQVPEAARRVERAFSTILAAAGRGRSPTVDSEGAAADRSGLVGADAEQGGDCAGGVDSADSSVVYSSHDLHIHIVPLPVRRESGASPGPRRVGGAVISL